MKTTLHQTHIKIADFETSTQYLKTLLESNAAGIHLLPELFLCGYPLQDLCLQKSFIESYESSLKLINKFSKKLNKNNDQILILGGLKYELGENGLPKHIYNGAYILRPGSELEWLGAKMLLPNYDIFDERKYFTPGETPLTYEFQGKKIGVLICEDMWPSLFYKNDPVELLKGKNLDLIVNLSASPFNIQKMSKRLERGREISQVLGAPFAYVNRIGAEDEIIFDGQSFVITNGLDSIESKSFLPDTLECELEDSFPEFKNKNESKTPNTWEDLFAAKLTTDCPTKLTPLSEEDCQEILKAMHLGLQDYAAKNGFSKFTVALSGGIDSALVLTLVKLFLKEGQSVEAIYMPGQFSAGMSYDLSLELCKKQGIPFKVLPIKFLHSTAKNAFLKDMGDPLEGLADENIQSRLRGLLLYARSNQTNSMVINTSNKSELAVGYSTQYGDSVGALSLLGDLYKSEVYRLCQYINQYFGDIIPEGIITRPPSAELRADQKDSDSLPEYDSLDAILEGILSYRHTPKELEEMGLVKEDITKTLQLYRKTEFKRFQFCPIIKLRAKSFGFGYRNPISKSSEFYF